MKHYKLTPLDTLFFRGGQPFNAGETGQMEVAGQFPPTPASLVGTLRAALARANGWDGKSNWSGTTTLKAMLGDGDDDLGKLIFQGPYLLRHNEPIFPVPLHILGKTEKPDNGEKDQMHFTRLKPGKARKTDIGEVQLPKIDNQDIKDFKALEAHWLTLSGMQKVLSGELPNSQDVLEQQSLWSSENRVGIQRDYASKTTKDNALYQTAHVRLAKDVALAVSIEGLPNDWKPQNPSPLGGESRQAWIDGIETLPLPTMPELRAVSDKVHYAATLLTPANLTGNGWRTPRGEVKGLAGHVVSACIGKPILIGGWDSLKHEPKTLEPYLPAGSTFFMEANANELQKIQNQHGKHIGEKTNWGYGQILIGRW